MKFREIIGQQDIIEDIQQMSALDRMPHALLFLGAEGSGKLALALALGQFILCSNKQNGDACGRCSNCIKASKLIHPDLHFSFPTIGSKATSDQFLTHWRTMLAETHFPTVFDWLQRIGAENKQGNITKEECLKIVKKLSFKTFEATHKVLIMWMPEYLGNEGNRLLKLIEEPPQQTVFILVAAQQELILNTILSRCQLFKVNPLQDEAIVRGLLDKGITQDRATEIAQLANGNFAEALKLANEVQNSHATLFVDWLRTCYKGNIVELVRWVADFATHGRENQKFFLQFGLHFMREFLLFSITNQTEKLRLGATEKKTVANLKKIIGLQQIEQIAGLLDQLIFHVERNANPKILFLDASFEINKLLRQSKSNT